MHIQTQPLFHRSLSESDLLITQSGYVTTDHTWHQRPMYAAYSRLYFIVEGAGMLISDTEELPLEPGYVYLAPCGSKCGFYGCKTVTKLYFHINLQPAEGLADVFSSLTHFSRIPMPVDEARELIRCYLSTEPLDHLMLKGALYGILTRFLRTEDLHSQPKTSYSDAVTAAVRYICSHLSARLTVKDVSEAVFCSQSKLSSLFRKEMGQSIAKYVDDLLMSEAKNQLLYTKISIGKISERLGFCDQFYFSRIFRKRFGKSPIEFRRRGEH